MSVGPPPFYRVIYSGPVRETLRGLAEQARQRGKGRGLTGLDPKPRFDYKVCFTRLPGDAASLSAPLLARSLGAGTPRTVKDVIQARSG